MSSDILPALQALDPALLTALVRQDQRDPALEVLDWTVEPLTHEKIIGTTGGLFCFSGTGRGGHGTTPWTIVLKVINNPKEWAQDPRYWAYWKREWLAFQSGMLANLPDGISAPRCYGTTEREEGGWVWMEKIVESVGRRWSLQHYHDAACQLGRFDGAFLEGAPLPDYPWLSAPFFRSVFADGDWWATQMDPDSPKNAWQSLLVQQAFAGPLRSRILRIWVEKRRFFEANDRLPQVLCHNDFHRRNLMWRAGAAGQSELVALDWAFCGRGAIGNDLGALVATSTYFFEVDPADTLKLEEVAFDGYVAGLRDVGWSGDTRLARLGYTSSAALWMGATLPGWAAEMLDEKSGVNVQAMYGRSAEAVLAGWVTLAEFALERADEARSLMRTLGVA